MNSTNRLALEAFSAEMAGDHIELARIRRAQSMEGRMTTHDNKFRDVIAALERGIEPPATELAVFEREAREAADRGAPYPSGYYKAQRDKILGRVAYGESRARAALAEYRDEALADARETRAANEAGRDPQQRIADEMERARLIGSSVSADALAQQARDALAAKQPRRADLLLSAALDKGWKGGHETDPKTGETVAILPRLRTAIEDAIDSAEPDRQRARSLEESVAASVEAFAQARRVALAKHGIGVAPDGSIGSGQTSQVASASLSAKMAAYRAGVPAPDGLLTSVPTGEPARSKAEW